MELYGKCNVTPHHSFAAMAGHFFLRSTIRFLQRNKSRSTHRIIVFRMPFRTDPRRPFLDGLIGFGIYRLERAKVGYEILGTNPKKAPSSANAATCPRETEHYLVK